MNSVNEIPDMPSSRHGKSFELGFADGHMENIKLQASLANWENDDNGPDPDWAQLKARTTIQK